MIPFPNILLFPLIISFIAYPNCIFLTGAYSTNGLVDLIKKNVKGALCTVKELACIQYTIGKNIGYLIGLSSFKSD